VASTKKRGRSGNGGAAGGETILVAAEAAWIRDQVQVAFVEPGQRVIEVQRGQDVRDAVGEYEPEVVILDMQIGNMGGIAVALDLRLEAGEGRLPHTPILLLLDREADKFLALRSDVDAVLVKPIDAGRLRRTVKTLLPDRVAKVAAFAAASTAASVASAPAAEPEPEPEPEPDPEPAAEPVAEAVLPAASVDDLLPSAGEPESPGESTSGI
jgi:DNA-binding response OmpR family regulator